MFSKRAILCWLAVWLAAMLTYDYYFRIEDPAMDARVELHHMIVDGGAPYQYRYRVLLPYMGEGLARLIQHLPYVSSRPVLKPLAYSKRAFVLAFSILNWSALVILFWSLGELLWRLTKYEMAPFGIALAAVMTAFTFRNHTYHPWSFWEGASFALGLLLIHRGQYWLTVLVALVSLLNRETYVFLIVAFVLIELPNGPGLRIAIGSLAVWIAGWFALHAIVGYSPSTAFLGDVLAHNLDNLGFSLLLNVLMIGIPLPLVWRGLQRSPVFLRRAALMLPPYVAMLLVIGYWLEIRYWISALPVVVPAIACAVIDA